MQPLQGEFEAAVADAKEGDLAKLTEFFQKVQDEDYEYSEESFVLGIDRAARKALGDEAYDDFEIALDDAVARASEEEVSVEGFGEDEEQEADIEDGTRKDLVVETRGSPERRAAFRAKVPTYKQNLATAQKTLAAQIAEREKRIKAEAKKVLKAAGKLKLEDKTFGKIKVTGYDQNGFTIKFKGGTKTFGWGLSLIHI